MESAKSEKIREFTDLHAWQFGHQLVLGTLSLANRLPEVEKFGLASQMKRSAISVTSNIAEGFGRTSKAEKRRFYFIAKGSLIELQNQLIICRDAKLAATSEFNRLYDLSNRTGRLLLGLIRGLKITK